jgi:drug/metabolite transporter (DMT)-like permease
MQAETGIVEGRGVPEARMRCTTNIIQYGVGAVFALPLALFAEGLTADWSAEFFAVMAYLVIGNSLVAITLLLAMIRAGEVARVSALFYLVPPLAALFAWPLLGEAMPPLAWAGMALAALGVMLARTGPAA